MSKIKEEKENNSAYDISLEIINFTEKSIFKRFYNLSSDNSMILKSISKELEKFPNWVQKINTFFIQVFNQFIQLIIKPILIITYGLFSSIERYFLVFVIIFLLVFALTSYINSNSQIELSENTIFTIILLLSVWMILFKKNPSNGKKESKLLIKLRDELILYKIDKVQWGYVRDNINLFKDNSNKRIIFITSFSTFIWGSYLLLFKFYQSGLNIKLNGTELIHSMKYPLITYIIILLLIRIYSKVYRYVFEMINLSINEILFLKNSSESNN